MSCSKVDILLACKVDDLSVYDHDLLSVSINDDNWFWVRFDFECKYIHSTNGVGGDASEIEVEKLNILSITDEVDGEITLNEDQMKSFKRKVESCLLENEYDKHN